MRRRFTARDAVICVAVAVLLLVIFQGPSIRDGAEEMKPGWERTLVLAAARPAGWVGDQLPFAAVSERVKRWARGDSTAATGGLAAGTRTVGVQDVTRDAFDPAALGAKPTPPRPLRTVLVTGDSMAQPLDAELARRLAGVNGVRTVRDAHVGTGLAQSQIADWNQLAADQVRRLRPEAVVMFMGANEGWPMRSHGRTVQCCGLDWAAEYAIRVRRIMEMFRQGGAARIYWLLLPTPRSHDLADVARAVNAAIPVAAQPWRAQVRVLDMNAVFTPGGRYRDAMPVAGVDEIVRNADGVHLNERGAGLAADRVLAAMRADFPSLPR
jgi:lysophospholipase L1-like esterase